jgi:hypothetical protein
MYESLAAKYASGEYRITLPSQQLGKFFETLSDLPRDFDQKMT